MATNRDPRFFLFVLVLLLLINSPDPQPQSFTTRARYEEAISEEWAALDVLNTTRFGDFQDQSLNLTGLRGDDGFSWDLLGAVQQRAKDQAQRLLGEAADPAFHKPLEHAQDVPVYRNLSGFVQGEWVRSPLGRIRHPSELNLTAVFPDNPFPLAEFERNLTSASGSIRIHITEAEGRMETDTNRTVSEISARIVIGEDTGLGDWWEFILNGVHFPEFGGTILTTTSEKFAGIFALPHFTTTEYLYSLSQGLLNKTISETIQRQTNRPFPIWNPWTSAADGSSEAMMLAPRCEYIIMLQTHPVEFLYKKDKYFGTDFLNLEWIEHELRYPTGSPLPRRSPFAMSMVGFSPDCGFVFESKGPPDYSPAENSHLVGLKTEEYVSKSRRSTIIFAATLVLQLLLLVKQMKETATPSTRNRVSFYTIAMLALGDGFASLTLVFLHIILESSQLVLYATAFLAVFSVVLELRFLMDIWTVQLTEQIRQERQQNPPAAQNADSSTEPTEPTATSEGLPLPVTAGGTPSLTPIITSPDQDNDPATEPVNATAGDPATGISPGAQLGALYTRYCLLLIFVFFMTLHSTSLWSSLRSIYFNTLCFIYLSFWCPQIYRNIMRNCRKALRWDFVLGQSFVRLVPIAYFYAASENILFSQQDTTSLLVLIAWVWFQILALVSQEVLGSRFFIREGWAPPAYDYHPVLREDEEGAMMPIGPINSPEEEEEDSSGTARKPGESKGKGTKVFDCSICAQDIEVPVVPSDGSTDNTSGIGGIILTRRAYMVTPCRHIFHTPCLEGWMRYRLQCPNCREILPPL